jgi:tRNA (guanine-N7-)-methyltransferase
LIVGTGEEPMRVRRPLVVSEPSAGGSLLDLGERTPPLDWSDVFSFAPKAIEIEIGSGKGMFLRDAALARPEHGFLGVERAEKWLAFCAARLARDERRNVRLVRHDAFDLLARWVPSASVAAIHVYFPDPWPKKRHAKRRLLHPALYDLAARALREGGMLAIATDVDWYFAEAVEALARHACFTACDGDSPVPGGPPGADVRTHYARKYAEQGRSLFTKRLVRTSSPPPPVPPPPSRPRKLASTPPPPAGGASP